MNEKCKYCLKIHNKEEKCKKEDLQEALEKYETWQFCLKMKDHWTRADFDEDREYDNAISAIKKMIESEGE